MFWMFMTALWVVMLLAPLALLAALLPAGRDCPRCGTETFLLRSRALRAARRLLGRRWCSACGWEGLMRTGRPGPAPVVEAARAVEEIDDDAAWRGDQRGY
jgi:ribosomal protein S27AE